jgi:hypothetical protein
MKPIFISHSGKHYSVRAAETLSAELERHGYTVLRSPEFGQSLETGIQDCMRRAGLIVALLTDPSPNVLFEVGYASGLGKRVVLVVPPDANLPMDLRSFSYIEAQFDSPFAVEEIVGEVERAYEVRVSTENKYTSYRDILRSFETDPNFFEMLDSRRFERCLFDLFQDKGFEPEEASADEYVGVDVFLRRYGIYRMTLVEAKKYNKNSRVSVTVVQQLFGAIATYGGDHGIIVTSSGFTRSAIDFAAKRRPEIELWDMDKILSEL